MFIVPAHKDNSQVTRGRGKGGLATIWDRKLTNYVSKVKTENFRLQATKFNLPSGSLLIINTYFPCDPRTGNFDDRELLTLLSDIQNIVLQSNCNRVWLGGDLNSHFKRQSRFTNLVKDYFEEIRLYLLWENPDHLEIIPLIDYTYLSSAGGVQVRSTIDHFACSRSILPIITEAGVLHSGDNTSNHSAIFAKLTVGNIKEQADHVNSEKKVDWDKSSEQARVAYKDRLTVLLDDIACPACITCSDLHCKVHAQDIEDYAIDILEAVEGAAKDCLATKGGRTCTSRKNTLPGWREFVKPYQTESLFWHGLWSSANKPAGGPLFEAMRHSKNQYKYAVRRLKIAGDKIQNDKFVKSLFDKKASIFTEIKKFRGTGRSRSSRIDEEVGDSNIANHFATIYSEIYNKVELRDEFENLCNEVDQEVTDESCSLVNKINDKLIQKALKIMQSNKADATFNFQSDCIMNGPPALIMHLTNLVKSIFSHGVVPSLLLLCTLLPIVKDNLGDITSSENYRAIASGSLLLKLIDIVILLSEGDKLTCDELQFGFQPNSGTVMCSWAASAVIDHFNSKGRAVYGCAMDLSKAFDMVDWKELFLTLRLRNVDPLFLRVLLHIYRYQQCNVKWGQNYSQRFSVRNGVRQGAISSPVLFSVYINGLIAKLRSSGFGCYIGTLFMGCLGFADDILLLSGSRTGLQVLVDTCAKFVKKKNLKFSTNTDPEKSKTKCIVFSKNPRDRVQLAPVRLNDDPLPWVSQVKHLGNVLQSDNSFKVDCTLKRGKFIGKVNSLLQEFHFVEADIFIKILSIYTTSFYGSGLWDLYSKEVDRLYKAWNVSIRRALSIPNTTHRYLIEPLSGCLHPKVMLSSRLVRFRDTMAPSNKLVIRLLANLFEGDRRTVLGRNLGCIRSEVGGGLLNPLMIKKNLRYFETPADEQWRVSTLSELLEVRSGRKVIDGLTSSEVDALVKLLCSG